MNQPPTPAAIKAIRKKLGLGEIEFEEAIGYSTDGRITQALEAGTRNNRVFEMTGPAQTALGYLMAIKSACDILAVGDKITALHILQSALPEKIR